jgi:hypothetical protein
MPVTEEHEGRYGASVDHVGRVRTERSVIAFLAFIGVLMAFGIDAALPAFDQLSKRGSTVWVLVRGGARPPKRPPELG